MPNNFWEWASSYQGTHDEWTAVVLMFAFIGAFLAACFLLIGICDAITNAVEKYNADVIREHMEKVNKDA